MTFPDEFDEALRKSRVCNRDKYKEEKRKKVQALLNNPAATEGEKQAAREALKRIG